MNNRFVKMAIDQFKVYGEKGISHVYFNVMSKQDREEFDEQLVAIDHQLAYEAGTNEYRFKSMVKSLIY